MGEPESSVGLRLAGAVWTLAALAYALSWLPKLAGDAVIHLTFMEHAAAGQWFRFNPGPPDPSSSSPVWTALGAGLWRLGGVAAALGGIKLVGYAAWLLLPVIVASLGRQLGAGRPAALASGLALFGMPGPAMNALVGMENGTFAAILVGANALVGRQLATSPSPGLTLAAGIGIGLGAALRPEGAVAGAALLAGLALAGDRRWPRPLVLLGALAALAAWAPFAWILHDATGTLVPGSGVSRIMAARRQLGSLALGPLWVHGRPLALLAAWLPLAGLAGRGLFASRGESSPTRLLASLLAVQAAVGLGLYTFVTGAFHASRYMIWLFALAAPLAALGLDRIPPHRVRKVALLAAVWWGATALGEAGFRLANRDRAHDLRAVAAAPELRSARTDSLLGAVCRGGCCADSPTEVALGEVQLRFFVDERIRVVSLDGTTAGPGAAPVRFDARGCPDLDALTRDGSLAALLRGFDGYGLDRCLDSAWTRGVAAGWHAGADAAPLPGWRWESSPRRMLIRSCDPGEPSPAPPGG